MTMSEFANGFNKLAIYYDFCAGRDEMLKNQASIYFEFLKHLSVDEWERAISVVISERTYQAMPKVAELINALEGSVEERAVNAFNIAISAMGQIGTYASVRFEDDAIMAAISAMGGWVAFGDIEVGNTPMATAKRKEFISNYLAFRNKSFARTHLRGIAEIENRDDTTHNRYMLVAKSGDIKECGRDEVAMISPAQKQFNELIANASKKMILCAK